MYKYIPTCLERWGGLTHEGWHIEGDGGIDGGTVLIEGTGLDIKPQI